ncbi:MAG: hypothetical protein MO847_02820 [Candidatus Protistobacter heckmanni]|nr:hypothetical protein [Candidatus Protistobacter heckmanni]
MLRPRKHPLIDQPLIAASSSTFRRLRWTLRTVVLVALLAGGAWFWLVQNSGDEIYIDSWWRNALSDLVSRQFRENISEAKDSRMGERVKAFETERAEMQAKLQSLDKLVQASKMDGWLRQFSAKRETDNEISYELLLSNPHPGQAPPSGGKAASQNIVVLVRGIDRFDLNSPETGVTQSALRFKTVKHELGAPRVAETLRGRVGSKAASFLIATVIPFDNPALTEVRIIPVGEASRSP